MNRVNNSGFTLVELLVGVLIFSIVMVTLFSSFNAFVFSSRTVNQDVLRSEEIKHALTRISMDLESLFVLQPPRYQKPSFDSPPDSHAFLAEEEDINTLNFTTLTFSSLAHADISSTSQGKGVVRIRYFVKQDMDGRFDLFRTDVFPSVAGEDVQCNAPVLCRDIKGFSIKFYNKDGDEYDYWDSDSDVFFYTMPVRVDIKITFALDASEDRSQVFQTGMVMTAGRDLN